MAKYHNNNNKLCKIDLTSFEWSIVTQSEWDYECMTYDECLETMNVALRLDSDMFDNIIEDVNPIYPDSEDFVELAFEYESTDTLHLFPRAVSIAYPINDFDHSYRVITLSQKEKTYFSNLLYYAIGDADMHTRKMQKIMQRYEESVDKTIYNFVNAVIHGAEVLPITIGYLSDNQRKAISTALHSKINFASRCIMDADAVRHIINGHGENGDKNHCMKDIKDIARMAYVFANFDEATFEGRYSPKKYKLADNSKAPHIVLKKRINGTYYIIEAVSDAKTNLCHIVSAYIT